MFLSTFVCNSSIVVAGEYSLNDAVSFEIATVVPIATGSIAYTSSLIGVVQIDSAAPGSVVSGSTSVVNANDLVAGAAYSVSSGFAAVAANGDWGLAFSSGTAHSAAGFVVNGFGTPGITNSGTALAGVTNPGPNVANAEYDANGEVGFVANAVPAVLLSTALSGQSSVTVAANVTPAFRGFVSVPGTPVGTWRLVPPVTPFVGTANATTPAIFADIADTQSVTLEIDSGNVPVMASSNVDGRAALGVVAISLGDELHVGIDLESPALALTTSANNSSAVMSLGSSLGAGVSAIDISGDDAVLSTSGNSSHAMVAALASQQQTAMLPITLSGDDIGITTTGDNSWGAVAFGSSVQNSAATRLELSGARTGIATSGSSAGGAMISADGSTEGLAGLVLSGSESSISTSNDNSLGVSLVATSPLQGAVMATLSGANSSIRTEGIGSTALLLSASGGRATAGLELSGAQSMLTTLGQASSGVLAVAHGDDEADVSVNLSGAGSRIATSGDGSSAGLVASIAENAQVRLALSGNDSSIVTSGQISAGFIGTAIGATQAVAEATLSGPMARISTEGDNSVGLALTAIATEAGSTSRVGLQLTGSGSNVETFGALSSAATLAGSEVGLVVGNGAGLATNGATSHAALVLAATANVSLQSGSRVTTEQNDSYGLFFINPVGENTVSNSGVVAAGGSAIVSAGTLRLTNHSRIVSSAGAGVDLASGRIRNNGLIAGESAILRGTSGLGPVSIENHGRILANAGPGNVAISLLGGFDDELAVAPHGIIVGTIELGGGADLLTALPGTNLDFLFETAPPEEVVAITGVQVMRPDLKNVVIVDPGYLSGAATQSGLAAARLAAGGNNRARPEVAQGDCGGTEISARANGSYDKTGNYGDQAAAISRSYGVLTGFVSDICTEGGVSFFLGANQLRIDSGHSNALTSSAFAGGNYKRTTDSGVRYEFLGGVGYLSGRSHRQVLNNRIASGIEIAEAEYSSWMAFGGIKLSRPIVTETMEFNPFLQAHIAYGGGFHVQETGIQTPALFDVSGGFGYDVRAGMAVSLKPAMFDAGVVQVSFSGALVVAGSDEKTAISLPDGSNAFYARNNADIGLSLGSGLDIEFDSTPASLHFEAFATAWSHDRYGFAIQSEFKYRF